MRSSRLLQFFVVATLVVACVVSAPLSGQESLSGNPVLPGWYADPEAHVFAGKYWIHPTYSAPYDEQTFMGVPCPNAELFVRPGFDDEAPLSKPYRRTTRTATGVVASDPDEHVVSIHHAADQERILEAELVPLRAGGADRRQPVSV